MARILLRTGAFLVAASMLLASSTIATGQEWLPGGGFEEGTSGWTIQGAAAAICTPRSGDGALGIDAEDSFAAEISRALGPMPAGSYTVSGWAKLQSGTGDLDVILLFAGSSGSGQPRGINIGQDYQYFAFDFDFSASTNAGSLLFKFQPDGFAVLCLDDLAVTSEDLPSPTPTTTPSIAPSPTSTPLPAATTPAATVPPPTATSTSTPTSTPSPSATAQASPSPTPGPSFVFINGGFEDGLAGWSKYGGTLTTSANALSGSTAGLLLSDTESTKWAYQAVRIEPAQYYEFSAHVQPDSGEAYLRISWYTTSDASGSAISTSDSLQRAGPGPYAYLTTGPVLPPPGAASARVRILLAPGSAAPASLSMDDVSFGITEAPAPTPTASPTAMPSPTATSTPPVTPTVASLGALASPTSSPDDETPQRAAGVDSRAVAAPASGGTATPGVTEGPVSERFQQVAASRSEARASSSASSASLPSGSPDSGVLARDDHERAGGISWPWFIGATMLIGGLAGLYWQSRRAGA